jgi:glutathione S-transferase
MHSGFSALRGNCPMNIEASLPDAGGIVWRDKPEVRGDVARIVEMWSALLDQHGGPMLFGELSIADAYFAPVCMRFATYALPGRRTSPLTPSACGCCQVRLDRRRARREISSGRRAYRCGDDLRPKAARRAFDLGMPTGWGYDGVCHLSRRSTGG